MKIILLFVVAFVCAACASWAETVKLPDAFEGDWGVYFTNCRGKGAAENGVLTIRYDFSGGDYTSHVGMGKGLASERMPSAYRFKVRKTAAHGMSFRIVDSENETFQKRIAVPACPVWQTIEVSLTDFGETWGDRKNDIFDGSVTGVGFAIERGLSEVKSGILEITDLEAVYTTEPERPLSLDKAPFGSRTTAEYYAELPKISETEFRGDLELKGDVQALLIPASAGSVVTVRAASQFTTFTMTQTAGSDGRLEFPCGPSMEGWTAGDMKFGGTLPGPLRLTAVEYSGGTAPAEKPVCRAIVKSSDMLSAAPVWSVKGKNAVFTVNAKSLASEPQKAFLRVTVKTYDGVIVKSLDKEVTLSGLGQEDRFVFECPFAGEPFLEAVVNILPDPSARVNIGKLRCSTVALNTRTTAYPSVKSRDIISDSPYGMGVYLYRRSVDTGEMAEVGRLAGDIGIKWTREEFNWGAIEQQKGVLDYSFYDKVVDTALENGIQVYGLLAYWNGWYPQDTDEGREAYYHFVRETVLRYKDRINYWEIWNEPNIAFFPGPKENYFMMLRHCYDMIKEIDPSLKVLGCSTSELDRDFIKRTIDAGCDFDVLTVHPYRSLPDDDKLIRDMQEIVGLTKTIDGTEREVWITEMGWPTQVYTGATEREQAALITRSYAAALSVDHVSQMSWYNFINDGLNRYYNEHSFGTMWKDLAPKPAYISFATLLAMSAGAKPVQVSDICPGVHAFSFKGKNSLVMWSEKDGLYSAEGGDAVFYDMLGRKKDARGMIYLQAGTPVYAVGNLKRLRPVDLWFPECLQAGEGFAASAEGCTVTACRLPAGFRAEGNRITAGNIPLEGAVLDLIVKRGSDMCHAYPSVSVYPQVLRF